MKKGLRVAGLLAMAIAIAHCGDSDVRVSTGPGVVPSPGTFNGTLSDGGSISIDVGSIEAITFDCDDERITETFTPPQEIENDGTFVLKFSDGGRQFRIEGQFRDNNTVDGVINDENNECDVSYDAFRGGPGERTATPARTPTPGGVTATPDGNGTATPGTSPSTSTSITTSVTPDPNATATPTVEGSPCPVAVEVEGDAGTQKVLDSGWTGLAHNATVVSDGKLSFSVSNCDSPVRPCGTCDLGGPIANPNADAGDINSQRCSNDPFIKCTSNAQCTAPGTCVFFFGAPLPLSAGGISSCVLNQVSGDVSGTANVETGEFASTINLISRVAIGPTDQPCPVCDGDPTPNDGVAGGTCAVADGGQSPRAGLPCDTNGTSPIAAFGSTSLDCLPSNFLSALTIPLAGGSGRQTRTIDNATAPCTGAIGKKCFCPGSGLPPAPNSCLDDSLQDGDQSLCVPIGNSETEGQCPALADTVCSPLETFRSCLSNNDCTPGSGDTCVAVNRPCYLDNGVVGGSIVALGEADPPTNGIANPTFASIFCIPRAVQDAINTAAGLPGIGRVQLPLVTKEILP